MPDLVCFLLAEVRQSQGTEVESALRAASLWKTAPSLDLILPDSSNSDTRLAPCKSISEYYFSPPQSTLLLCPLLKPNSAQPL